MAFSRLFSPLKIGNFTVANRFVMTTHASGHSERRWMRYLQERARGGVGLFGIPASEGTVNFAVGPGRFNEQEAREYDNPPLNPATPEGVAYYDKTVTPALRRRAEILHSEGAKVFGQVHHRGAARHGALMHPPVGPSQVPDPYEADIPHELTVEEIAQIVFGMAHGIRRAKEAGLDAAEIHAAHGYLFTEFLSPYFNRRTDQYGGSVENRARIVLEIIAAARQLVGPDYPIGIRLGLDGDGEHSGITIEQQAQTAGILAPHIAYVSVSGGTYSGLADGLEVAYVSPWYVQQGHNVKAAAAVKKAVGSVPVFVTGRITDPATAENILAEGAADMIGMVRALIVDPEFPKKAREGRPDDIRMCLGMDECHYIGERKPVSCAVNAAAGREDEMQLVPAQVKKMVLVIGAGPAGMEAARVAALRGHHTYLADRVPSLGGTVRLLSQDPNRRNLADMTVFFKRELERARVELLLGEEITEDMVLEMAPDAVIVATGGVPFIPEVPGIASSNVVTATAVLAGQVDVGKKVLVVGGLDDHLGPPTIAEFLADQGREVEFISEHLDVAGGVEHASRYVVIRRLMNKGVTISPVHRLIGIEGRSVTVLHTFTRKERCINNLDTVVLACGHRANDDLGRALRGKVKEVHLVGDSLAPRRIMHAVLDGARAAQML